MNAPAKIPQFARNVAGGIGGLLARSDNQKNVPAMLTAGSPGPQNTVTSYYFSDANGNVVDLVSPSGMVLAQYEYDPFGNVISKFGLMADMNKYRFSSKQWNERSFSIAIGLENKYVVFGSITF